MFNIPKWVENIQEDIFNEEIYKNSAIPILFQCYKFDEAKWWLTFTNKFLELPFSISYMTNELISSIASMLNLKYYFSNLKIFKFNLMVFSLISLITLPGRVGMSADPSLTEALVIIVLSIVLSITHIYFYYLPVLIILLLSINIINLLIMPFYGIANLIKYTAIGFGKGSYIKGMLLDINVGQRLEDFDGLFIQYENNQAKIRFKNKYNFNKMLFIYNYILNKFRKNKKRRNAIYAQFNL